MINQLCNKCLFRYWWKHPNHFWLCSPMTSWKRLKFIQLKLGIYFFKRFICSVSICLMAPIMVIYVMKFRMNAESILCLEISADVLKTGYHKGGEEFEHVKRGSYHFSDSVLLIEISQIVIGSRTWLSNFIHINLWCVIIQPCPNFSSCIDKPLFKLRHGWVMDKIWHGKFLIYA